ncbi:ECF RNA polymerase sigma factor SigK [Nocardioides luteus]|uniref:RNA polymerase sigma factor SigK n=1 Tax=Nocardioides luteus TaxID=1844 RepID=A0ABQ5T1Y2_9ACTN|nr:ECF RNA polymerase sigma factor SigK [Nocardioides luteus]GGR63923.1 RNA polymerase sigma factor SigK [Nocardioides luteus]GLJ70450.1 RNA polymerase sigma factor SigK [Nocardioides luteus]
MRPLSSVPSGDSSPEGTGSPGLAGLLRRIARGDEAAFAALYDQTAARVHGLVLRVVRDPAQAEEVTQEAFLQVWRQASRYDENLGSAHSWLLTLAHRRAVDRVRSAESASRNDTAYHGTTHAPAHDTTAEAAESSLEARRVHAALETLTAAQREALQLAYFGGYTHTEVAAMLDLPVGTAKTRIRDGLIRLRDAMGVNQ